MEEFLKIHKNGQWELVEKTWRAQQHKRLKDVPAGAAGHRPKAEGEAEGDQARESMDAPDSAPNSNTPRTISSPRPADATQVHEKAISPKAKLEAELQAAKDAFRQKILEAKARREGRS